LDVCGCFAGGHLKTLGPSAINGSRSIAPHRDEILDVFAMAAISRTIGFHALLLPTFVIEFLPVADMLPTWTGSVALVLTLRRRKHVVTTPPSEERVIDI
jgi:hypothetical protein